MRTTKEPKENRCQAISCATDSMSHGRPTGRAAAAPASAGTGARRLGGKPLEKRVSHKDYANVNTMSSGIAGVIDNLRSQLAVLHSGRWRRSRRTEPQRRCR